MPTDYYAPAVYNEEEYKSSDGTRSRSDASCDESVASIASSDVHDKYQNLIGKMSGSLSPVRIVNKHSIARACDICPSVLRSDITTIDPQDYEGVRSGMSVYVISSAMPWWLEGVLGRLRREGVRNLTLVTGEATKSMPGNVNVDEVFRDDVVTRWFTQNCDYPTHPRIQRLPLGIDQHTLAREEHWGEPVQTPEEQEGVLLEIARNARPWAERKRRVLLDAHLTSQTNPTDREEAQQMLGGVDFVDLLPASLPRTEQWRLVSEQRWIVSPLGRGMDCHRTQEAIVLGTIPIVKRTPLSVPATREPLQPDGSVLWVDTQEGLELTDFAASISTSQKSPQRVLGEGPAAQEGGVVPEELRVDTWVRRICSGEERGGSVGESGEERILFCGCVRNAGRYWGELLATIEGSRRAFSTASSRGIEFLFVESDSTDDTRERLEVICQENDDIHMITLGRLEERIPVRTMRMAQCRNAQVRWIAERERKQRYVAVLDWDAEVVWPEGVRGILERLDGMPGVYGITGNTPVYQDVWALRVSGMNVDCWEKVREDMSRGVSREEAIRTRVRRQQRGIPRDRPWREVISAFNGVAIQRASIFDGWSAQSAPGGGCEHVYFHEEVSRRCGGTLMLAPDLQIDNPRMGLDHLPHVGGGAGGAGGGKEGVTGVVRL